MVWEIREIRGGRARFDTLVPPVKVRDRLVPPVIQVEFYGDAEQPSLEIKIEVRQGIPMCTEVRLLAKIEGREIRPSDLKAVRLDSWIEQVVGVCSFTQPEAGGGLIYQQVPIQADRTNAARARAAGMTRPGRPRVSRERLEQAADIYRRHSDGTPLQVIAEVLDVSDRTAARYVEMCRRDDYGLLPKTVQGQRKA